MTLWQEYLEKQNELLFCFSFFLAQKCWENFTGGIVKKKKKKSATSPWFQMSPLGNTESMVWKLRLSPHMLAIIKGCSPTFRYFKTSKVSPAYFAI